MLQFEMEFILYNFSKKRWIPMRKKKRYSPLQNDLILKEMLKNKTPAE